ncbi:MAG: hypothetical protein NWR72_02230 [Bacteroidia bacterium]|nr:hypothetical protein [Bacteroidia bacterium]
MTYRNPYALLGLAPDEWALAEDESLRRKKKELLAELDAQPNQRLSIAGSTISKQELISLFEEMDQPQVRAFHASVARQPSLHDFLTQASLDYFYQGDISMLPAQEPEFLVWIAPWFSRSYNLRLVHAFRQRDADELLVLCSHPLPLPTAYLAIAYKDTYQLLHEHREKILAHSLELDQGHEPGGELQTLSDEWLINAINHLPEYFQGIRDAIAEAMEQLALTLLKRHNRPKLSLLVIRQALKLDISPSTRKKLEGLQQSLFAIHPEEEWLSWLNKNEGEGLNPWLVAMSLGAVGVILWLFSRWKN